MNQSEYKDLINIKAHELSDRVFKRAEKENLCKDANYMIFGLIFSGFDNLKNPDFIESVKRLAEILSEEYILISKDIYDIMKTESDVTEQTS